MPAFDIYEELRAMIAAFDARGIDYALCGARPMTPSELDARLRELAQLSNDLLDRPSVRRECALLAREARRGAVVDMSSDAIDARLRQLAAVSRLCASLARVAEGQQP